jgi:hypothetical protein
VSINTYLDKQSKTNEEPCLGFSSSADRFVKPNKKNPSVPGLEVMRLKIVKKTKKSLFLMKPGSKN